jgi:PAS domain S-box-containing protein
MVSEAATVTDTLEKLRRRGFIADFGAVPDGLRVLGRGQIFKGSELTIREYYRFEGVSDPDDMSIVYAIEGADGTRGTVVDAFGVYADPELGAVLQQVEIREAGQSGDGQLRSTHEGTRLDTDNAGMETGMETGVDLQAVVAAAGDAIIVADREGLIRLWNPAAVRLFGFTAEEAVGRSLDLIIPDRFRDRHWRGYREVVRTAETRYGTDVLKVPAVGKDGRRISIAFTVALLSDRASNVTGIAAIIRDETSRWEEEQALRRRLAELERSRAPA